MREDVAESDLNACHLVAAGRTPTWRQAKLAINEAVGARGKEQHLAEGVAARPRGRRLLACVVGVRLEDILLVHEAALIGTDAGGEAAAALVVAQGILELRTAPHEGAGWLLFGPDRMISHGITDLA